MSCHVLSLLRILIDLIFYVFLDLLCTSYQIGVFIAHLHASQTAKDVEETLYIILKKLAAL